MFYIMKNLLLGTAAFVLGTASMSAAFVDPSTYEKIGTLGITNLWLKSTDTGSDLCTKDLLTAEIRGMAAKNGKLYFPRHKAYKEMVVDKEVDFFAPSIIVYNGVTGEFEKEIPLSKNVERTEDGSPIFMPCNDMQFDAAGNALVSNLCTDLSASGFRIHRVNLETGEATPVFHFVDELSTSYRIDNFGVYGDIDKDGYFIMPISGAATVGGNYVVVWRFTNGQLAAEPEYIEIKEYVPAATTGNDTAPRCCPLDDNLFYLDGNASVATLYNMDGTIAESLATAPAECMPENPGNNGVAEFTLGAKNFVIYIQSNNVAPKIKQGWNICEFDINKGFSEMQKYYTIPAAGMGAASNANRIAIPRIEVNEAGTEALIYIYAANNGVGAYRFVDTAAGVADVEGANLKISTTNSTIMLSEVANVEIYNFAGQRLISKNQVDQVAVASGVYIVKAITALGEVATAKVIVE